jgi:hypothetical protein
MKTQGKDWSFGILLPEESELKALATNLQMGDLRALVRFRLRIGSGDSRRI